MGEVIVRAAHVGDAEGIARVIVRGWRETYRGLVPDQQLDRADFEAERTHFWRTALTDQQYAGHRVAVAELDDVVVGVASAGPPLDPRVPWSKQLYALYVRPEHHGRGAADRLLDAVLSARTQDEVPAANPARAGSATGLWVADPNPRAQAFYRRRGFVADGEVQHRPVRQIRMVRPPSGAPGRH